MPRCIFLVTSLLSALALNAANGPTLAVDANAARHPISPYIYGINNWSDNGLQEMMRIPLARWGGDDATSYNWQNSVKNNTGDNPWFYFNYSVSPGFDSFHEANLRAGTVSLGTIPLMDWVPKAPGECSFSIAKYGPQQHVSNSSSDCGNGWSPDGQTPINNDPNDAYVGDTPTTEQAWIQHLVGKWLLSVV